VSKIYGFDIDGCHTDFVGPFSEALRRAGFEMPEREEITSYYWHECVDGISKDEFWVEFNKFTEERGYENLPLLPEAKSVIDRVVAAGHELHFITNRPIDAYEQTIKAFESYGFPTENLHFAEGAKSPMINELDIDVFVEDSPSTILDIMKNTCADVYCMDQPYNRHIDEYNLVGLVRIGNWKEFMGREGL